MSGSPAIGPSARLPILDGLRGLVLLILFLHFAGPAAPGWHPWAASTLIGLFYVGVTALDVFFVLSGFLISGILLDTRHSPSYFRTFYSRRVLRIVPLYYGFLFLWLIVLPRVAPWYKGALSAREQSYHWGYLINVALSNGWPIAPYTSHLWTLSIEEQFYLVWPLLVSLGDVAWFKRVCIACLIIAPIARVTVYFLYPPDSLTFSYFTFARLDGFALGGLIAAHWRDQTRWAWFRHRFRVMVIAALAVAVAVIVMKMRLPMAQFSRDQVGDVVYLTVSVYCAAGLLMVALTSRPGSTCDRLIGNWPLRRVGLYSYGVYLLHQPLQYAFDRSQLLRMPVVGDSVLSATGYAAAMTAVTIAVAALSWHAFESPLLRLRRRYGSR